MVYDLDGNFLKEYDSISRCSYDLGVNDRELSDCINRKKLLRNLYIIKSKKYNYAPKKVSPIGFKVEDRVKYNIIVKDKIVERERIVITNSKQKILKYDMNGDFCGEYDSNKEASLSFSSSLLWALQ